MFSVHILTSSTPPPPTPPHMHRVKLRIRTECQQFSLCEDEGGKSVGVQGRGSEIGGGDQQPEAMETDCAPSHQDNHHQHTLTASQEEQNTGGTYDKI